jgi:hypothetical protein
MLIEHPTTLSSGAIDILVTDVGTCTVGRVPKDLLLDLRTLVTQQLLDYIGYELLL